MTRQASHITAQNEQERGVALVMALIFSILLYILVAELVVSSRMVRATGENDALLARMRTQMQYQMVEAEEKLLADLAGQAAAGEEGAPGLGELPGGGGEGDGARAADGGCAGGRTGGAAQRRALPAAVLHRAPRGSIGLDVFEPFDNRRRSERLRRVRVGAGAGA